LSAINSIIRSVNSTSDAVAQWYLTGVLELPAFWQESGPACPRRRIRKDSPPRPLRAERVVQVGVGTGEDEENNDIIFDVEGIDSFASAVVAGVSSWRPVKEDVRIDMNHHLM
jgi:hypothetical protein